MRKHLIVIASMMVLSACAQTRATLDTKIDEAVTTASGGIHEAANRIDQAVQPVIETANDVQERAGHVKSGWEKLMDAIGEFRQAAGD